MTSVCHFASVCCIAKQEHTYIEEFVAYHLSIGFEHVYIYDNGEPDDEPLSVYLKAYTPKYCTFIIYPGPTRQIPAYQHFIKRYASESEWVAFIDIDEFIVLPKHPNIQEFLAEYGKNIKSIGMNWYMFTNNGHIKKPPGFVIENYTQSCFNQHIKSLVHSSVFKGQNVKSFGCLHNITGLAKRLNDGSTISGPFNNLSHEHNDGVIRLNHYWCKSYEEYIDKMNRGRADHVNKRTEKEYHNFVNNAVTQLDDIILKKHYHQFMLTYEKFQ